MKTITNENEFFISSKKKKNQNLMQFAFYVFFAFTSDFDSVIAVWLEIRFNFHFIKIFVTYYFDFENYRRGTSHFKVLMVLPIATMRKNIQTSFDVHFLLFFLFGYIISKVFDSLNSNILWYDWSILKCESINSELLYIDLTFFILFFCFTPPTESEKKKKSKVEAIAS